RQDLDRLRRLPKVDLHCHLDGSLRVRTVLELGLASGARLPARDVDGLRPYCQVPPDCRGLAGFLAVFPLLTAVLRNRQAVRRAALELGEDAAAHRVIYLEARFAPYLFEAEGFTAADAVEAALAGMAEARRRHGIQMGLIVDMLRDIGPERAEEMVDLALEWRGRGVSGLDVAGDESLPLTQAHRRAFRRAREAGLPVTVHAGECGPPANIREALDELGARRIGHGVRLGEDPGLLAEVARREVPLEMCLTSNVQTCAVPSYEAHPMRRYLEAGLEVTINTDDPGVSATDWTREYALASRHLGLGDEAFRRMALTAARHAFLGEAEREALARRIREDEAWRS
ncbi:MAG: adenosine deaminase, partial [Planctomycetes bacterium]|nr:adenosine deaminase [Planctomycetota bacterium]